MTAGNGNEYHGDEHLLSDDEEYPPMQQWEIDEALADERRDEQGLDDNQRAYIEGFKAGSQTTELSAYERGVRAGILHKNGGNN